MTKRDLLESIKNLDDDAKIWIAYKDDINSYPIVKIETFGKNEACLEWKEQENTSLVLSFVTNLDGVENE